MDKFDEMITERVEELFSEFLKFQEKYTGNFDEAFMSWTIINLAKLQLVIENTVKAIVTENTKGE